MKLSVLKYTFILLHLVIIIEIVLLAIDGRILTKDFNLIGTAMFAGLSPYVYILHTESLGRIYSFEISLTFMVGLVAWFCFMTILLAFKGDLVVEGFFSDDNDLFGTFFAVLESFKAIFAAVLIPKIFPQERS